MRTIKRSLISLRLFSLAVLAMMMTGFTLPPAQLLSAPAVRETQSVEWLVTSTADSGEGSLREALQKARPGTVIRFDSVVFPVKAPAAIMLESALPELTTGRVTIDGSDAGVIIDGSLLGNEPEHALVDDVSLSFDGGPNILENGDFSPGQELDYWKVWQTYAVDNFRWNEEEGAQEPGCFEWTGSNRQFYMALISQQKKPFSNKSGDGNAYQEYTKENFYALDGAERVEARFWYRYGIVSVMFSFVNEFGEWQNFNQWFEYADFWDQAVFEMDVPEGMKTIAFDITISPTRTAHGLLINSNENVIQGLQIVNFPGSAIGIYNGSGNVIGGPNSWMDAGCTGVCNLLSGNVETGLMINGGERNIIQGNYIGTDISGTQAMKNGIAGVRIFDSHENQIGGSFLQGEGNLLSGNSQAIEINAEGEGSIAENNIIQGNLIGTDFTGKKQLANNVGIGLGGSSYTLIGGNNPDLRNIISGNNIGITMNGGAHHNLAMGNYIGTDITGLKRLSNDFVGVEMINGAYSNQVGGTGAGEGNIISGNGNAGVLLRDFESQDNRVMGNWIGLGADGKTSLPNRASGVYVENTTNHQIGPGNRIANNGDAGVNVKIEGTENGNTITQNSITKNQGPGIRVNVTRGGALPAVEDITVSNRSVLGMAPASTILELYQDTRNEGAIYLGTIEADDKGRFNWTSPVDVLLSNNITVLATDGTGTTGEFSKPAAVPGAFFLQKPGFPGPEQVDFSLSVFLLNTGIAMAAMLYFGVVATWFNESLENFSDEIAEKAGALLRRLKLARSEKKPDSVSPPLWNTLLKWLGILAVTAVIQNMNTPLPESPRQWFGELATLIVSGFLVTGLQIVSEWLLRRLSTTHTDVKETEVSGVGMVLALVSVVFSNIVNFGPGLVLGTVDGLYCSPGLKDEKQDGQRAFAAKASVAGLTFLGWWLSPLFDGLPGLQSLLVTMFIIGVQYAFFELIPLKVLDGFAVQRWNRLIWFLAFLLSMIGFVYINVNPNVKNLSDLIAYKESSLPTLGIMAGALLLVSLGLKIFTNWLEKEGKEQAAEAGD